RVVDAALTLPDHAGNTSLGSSKEEWPEGPVPPTGPAPARRGSMFRTMLVPVDGSELAERALAYATRIAAPVDGNVILLRAEALRMRPRPAVVSADPASTTWLVPD